MKHCLACLAGVVILLSAPLSDASAQIIPVKTTPIAEGDQFTFLPSSNRGLAGVAIALADSLHDPFTNPAAGGRVQRGYVFSSPSVYSLSRGRSSGSTIPIGAFMRGGSAFGAAGFALQRLSPPRGDEGDVIALSSVFTPVAPGEPRSNQYAFALAGTQERGALPAFGVSVFWSRLKGVEGAELLYPLSQHIEQHADAVALRAGMVKSLTPWQSLEAVIVHNRSFARHDVSYFELVWDPANRNVIQRTHVDQNFERTHLWGAQLQHRQRLRDSAWTVGTTFVANRTTQLTAPARGMMTVARNPGESTALNAGIGVARSKHNTTIAADAVYEPVWSRAVYGDEAADYRFSNVVLRSGIRHEIMSEAQNVRLQLQFGMQMRAIHHTRRSWNEWVHAWGMSLRALEFDLTYHGRVQSGVNRPGRPSFQGPIAIDVAPFFPFTPPGPVLLPVRVTTHQLSVSVPVQ